MNFKPSSSSPEESKKREYLKQQHQLRTMNKSSVPLSADNMIQTLLSKKEIFQKRNNQSEPSIQTPQVGPWPAWLTPGREPPFYKDVWKLVGSPNGLADTNRLSTLLMTSRLTTETLGYVWSLSNVTVPGSLTQQELYINLALVALAQSGYAFANSNVICQLKEAPLPALDVHILDAVPMISSLTSPMSAPSPLINPPGMQPATSAQSLEQSLSSPVPTITESISLLDLSHEPLSLIDSSPTKSLAVLSATDLGKDFPDILPKEPNLLFSDFQTGPAGIDDDFDDFKSADIFTSEMNSLTVLDVPDPKVENMKDSPKSDSGIEDLFPRCVIKPKSPDLMQTPPDEMRPSLDLLEDLTTADLTNSRTLPALDKSVISGFQFNESSGPSSLTFPLGLNSAESSLELSELTLGAAPLQCEPRSLDLNQIQSVPPVSLKRSSISGPDTVPPLQSVDPPQEDKYSALRLLDSGLFSEERSPSQEIGEDFGDFLTADVPPRNRPSQTLKDTDDDIQIKCLEACLKLLQEAVAIFENIENPKVLDEVATNEKGKTYLREILEVERIGRRIRSSRETCDQIIEFETLSKTLQPYIEYVKNIHLEEQDGPKCGICFCERGPAHVKYGINHFHAPCANLYLQLVDPILPIAPVM